LKPDKIIADTIVDVISEERMITADITDVTYKRGFFVEQGFFRSRLKITDRKMLITEEYIVNMIKCGRRSIKLPADSIITPSARLLIEEGRILIDE